MTTKKRNDNCLEGFECPKCGSLGPFWIQAIIRSEILMSDEGTVEERESVTDWEEDSDCRCTECGHSGEVLDFTENQ